MDCYWPYNTSPEYQAQLPGMSDDSTISEYETDTTCCYWKRLTTDLIHKIAGCLHPNEAAAALKLVDCETASALRDNYKTLYLSHRHSDIWKAAGQIYARAERPWPGSAFVAHWGRPEPWRSLSFRQRRRLLCLAASSGHAPSLDAALAHCGCSLVLEVMVATAAAGNLEGCERLLRQEGCVVYREALKAAAAGGHLPTLQLLLAEAHVRNVPHVFRAACVGGQLHVVTWLTQTFGSTGSGRSAGPDSADAAAAAAVGQVEMMEYLLSQLLQPLPLPVVMTTARGNGGPAAAGQEVVGAAASGPSLGSLGRAFSGNPLPSALIPCPPQPQSQPQQAGSPLPHPPPPLLTASGAIRRLELLLGLVLGCPLEVLRRHYHWLASGVVLPTHGAPMAAGQGAAAVAAEAEVDGGGGIAEDAAFFVPGDSPLRRRRMLLASAFTSPTSDWEAKLDFLLSTWGLASGLETRAAPGPVASAGVPALRHYPRTPRPELTQLVEQCLAVGTDDVYEVAWIDLAARPDFLARLQCLRAAGFEFNHVMLELAAEAAQPEALAYLWEECGMGTQGSAPSADILVTYFLHGCARFSHGGSWGVSSGISGTAGGAAGGVARSRRCLQMLRLLRDWGAVFTASHVTQAARSAAPEELVAWLLQEVAAKGEDTDTQQQQEQEREAWSKAFQVAAVHSGSLPVLQALRARGAAVCLKSVAFGGSEEALEWAAAELEAEGKLQVCAGGVGLRRSRVQHCNVVTSRGQALGSAGQQKMQVSLLPTRVVWVASRVLPVCTAASFCLYG